MSDSDRLMIDISINNCNINMMNDELFITYITLEKQ